MSVFSFGVSIIVVKFGGDCPTARFGGSMRDYRISRRERCDRINIASALIEIIVQLTVSLARVKGKRVEIDDWQSSPLTKVCLHLPHFTRPRSPILHLRRSFKLLEAFYLLSGTKERSEIVFPKKPLWN